MAKVRNAAIRVQVKVDMILPRAKMEEGKGNDNLCYVVSNLGLFGRPLVEIARLAGVC